MEIRIVSDLHLEYASVHIPNDMQILRNGTEAGQVLVLAGDICEYNHLEILKAFIQVQSERFYHVIYVPGNHEYYHNYFNDDAARKLCSQFKNVSFLNRDYVTVDGVNFIGTTLWSDHSRSSSIQRVTTSMYMNDFRVIAYTNNRKPMSIDDATREFNLNVDYLDNTLTKLSNQKNVVVTHHAPSPKSIHARFKGDSINNGFYSDLEDLIKKHAPSLWVHGHMHNAFDYTVGETRVICNPRGYPSTLYATLAGESAFENLEYDNDLVVTI